MDDDGLREELKRLLLLQVNGRMNQALLEAGYDQLIERRTSKVETALDARTEMILCDAVEEILEKVRGAGYSRSPAGDLRAQLLKLGRTLKAECFSRGYSGGDSVEEQLDDSIREAKADVKSEIGRAILDALEED